MTLRTQSEERIFMVAQDRAVGTTFFRWAWKTLGSLQLAVVLIVLLAVVLAWATILESIHGREFTQWFVYGSQWFVALLGLLGLNILAATVLRFPWKNRLSFLVTHAGLLTLLLGSIQTFTSGLEGHLSIVEGQAEDVLTIPTQTRFTAAWAGKKGSGAAAFVLQPGPVDWPDGKTLELGQLDGIRMKMLGYLRHARVEQTWVRDDSAAGAPALQFALLGPDGSRLRESWLVAEQFGGNVSMGPASFRFQRLPADTMVDDFLNPPLEGLGEMGILSIHHGGKVRRISVADHVGKKVPLDGGEISIEIKEYLPNAVPGQSAQFKSEGSVAANPMLEILVHGPGSSEPVRQIAFAMHPLLNFDGMHGWNSPVKFWYHHPAASAETTTDFVQSPGGTLYCRTASGGKLTSHGEVPLDQPIPTAAGFQVSVLKHLPSAREQVTFLAPSPHARGGKDAEAAALLEVQAGGATERLWLRRGDPTYGSRTISTPQGPLAIGFGYEELPLGFSVELLDFSRGGNPGGMGDASYTSQVRLVDPAQGVDLKSEITMNTPLTYGKYTLYQSSYQSLPSGKEASIFTVANDPGRFLKYVGCVMICAGSFAMFYARSIGAWTSRSGKRRHRTGTDEGGSASGEPRTGLAADSPQAAVRQVPSQTSQVA
ncbi:MAG: cytochrome c biogenesis protein ResB [Thermoguttaceae bacterium]